jgi:hypothetical protein
VSPKPFDVNRGSLRLLYVAPDGTETTLNDPNLCELHAELRGEGLHLEPTEVQNIGVSDSWP